MLPLETKKVSSRPLTLLWPHTPERLSPLLRGLPRCRPAVSRRHQTKSTPNQHQIQSTVDLCNFRILLDMYTCNVLIEMGQLCIQLTKSIAYPQLWPKKSLNMNEHRGWWIVYIWIAYSVWLLFWQRFMSICILLCYLAILPHRKAKGALWILLLLLILLNCI